MVLTWEWLLSPCHTTPHPNISDTLWRNFGCHKQHGLGLKSVATGNYPVAKHPAMHRTAPQQQRIIQP